MNGKAIQAVQDGTFVTDAAGTALSVEMEGFFGIGATSIPFLGFSVCAVDPDKPFIGTTGYRSFLGCSVTPQPDMTTDAFCLRIIEHYVHNDLKGRLIIVNKHP